MNSRLTIIMPMYNVSAYIEETIRSIKSQVYSDFKVIVLDDCSTDDSLTRCQKEISNDNRFTLISNKENVGYLRSTNKLLSLVETELCAFWDADDTCDKNRLFEQVNFIDKHKEIHLVGSYANLIDAESNFIRKVKYPSSISIDNFNVCGSSILFRYEILDTVGYYNPLFDRIGSEDFEWLLRATLKYNYFCIPESLYNYRRLSTSLTLSSDGNPSFLFSHKIVESLFEYCNGKMDDKYWEVDKIKIFFNQKVEEFTYYESLNPKGKLYQILESSALDGDIYTFYSEMIMYLKSHYLKSEIKVLIKYNAKLWMRVLRKCIP